MHPRNPVLLPAILVLVSASVPCQRLFADPLPAAVFSADACFDAGGPEQRVEFTAEGLWAYSFATPHDYGPPYGYFSGTIELQGGNLLSVRVTGDFGPRPGEAWAYANLRYYFSVVKTDPHAPSVPVPLLISASGQGSLVRKYGATRMPKWSAWVGYASGMGGSETLMGLPIQYTYDDEYSNTATFEGVRYQTPGVVGWFALTAMGEAYYWSALGEWQAGTFDVMLDPFVRIDPNFTVEVDGISRPGTEVYGLQFSEGIGPGIPEPATLSLLAMCGLALARRKRWR